MLLSLFSHMLQNKLIIHQIRNSSLLDSYLLMNKPIITIILKAKKYSNEVYKWLNYLININKPYINYYYVNKNCTGFKNIDDKESISEVTAYICIGFTCEKPINDINEFRERVNNV